MITLHDYQKKLVDQFAGYKPGELIMYTAGRQHGKSKINAAWMQQWLDELNAPRPITDLVLDTGKVYGARYYTVEPVGGNWKELEAWCKESFGDHAGAIWGADPNKAPLPNGRWYMNNSKFWFRSEKDRDWFIMRWSAT